MCRGQVLHLDIKSSNVLLTRSLTAKIGDVGIAVTMSEDGVVLSQARCAPVKVPWLPVTRLGPLLCGHSDDRRRTSTGQHCERDSRSMLPETPALLCCRPNICFVLSLHTNW